MKKINDRTPNIHSNLTQNRTSKNQEVVFCLQDLHQQGESKSLTSLSVEEYPKREEIQYKSCWNDEIYLDLPQGEDVTGRKNKCFYRNLELEEDYFALDPITSLHHCTSVKLPKTLPEPSHVSNETVIERLWKVLSRFWRVWDVIPSYWHSLRSQANTSIPLMSYDEVDPVFNKNLTTKTVVTSI